MDVLIRLERTEPPVGVVVTSDETDGLARPLPFVGWLGLLRALADVVRIATESAPGE
jgi:hypothetical protein